MGSLTIEELKALIWQAIQEWNDCNSDHNRCLTSLDIIDHVGHITCQIKPSDLEVEYEGEPLFANTMYLIDFIIGPDSQDDLQDISLSSKNPILRNLKVDSANVLDATSPDPILELKCTHSSDHFEDLLAKTVTRGMRDISTISHVCDVVYNTELPTSKIGITTSELLKGVEKMETKRNAEPKSEKTYEFESRVLSIKEMETFEWDGALYDGTDCPHIPLLGRWPIGVITAVSRDDETKLRTQQRHYVYLSVPKPPCHCSWMCHLNIVSHISTAAYSLGCILSLQNGATTLMSGIKTHVKHEHSKLLQCLIDHWSEIDETELIQQMIEAYEKDKKKMSVPSEASERTADIEPITDADETLGKQLQVSDDRGVLCEFLDCVGNLEDDEYDFVDGHRSHLARYPELNRFDPNQSDDLYECISVYVGGLLKVSDIKLVQYPQSTREDCCSIHIWLVVLNNGRVKMKWRVAGSIHATDLGHVQVHNFQELADLLLVPETMRLSDWYGLLTTLIRAWITCSIAYDNIDQAIESHRRAWDKSVREDGPIDYDVFNEKHIAVIDTVWINRPEIMIREL